jgi:hypothetical protein
LKFCGFTFIYMWSSMHHQTAHITLSMVDLFSSVCVLEMLWSGC